MLRMVLVLVTMYLVGCASTASTVALDSGAEIVAPELTENFRLVGRQQYPDPLYGVGFQYENRIYPSDVVTVYVYPINRVEWSDQDPVLTQESERVLAEVDYAVEQGHYASRSESVLSDFEFQSDEKTWRGKKSSFSLQTLQQVEFFSNTYLFILEDKYVKFRTSFDSRTTVPWNGDATVQELLPLIQVPPESDYMKQLRQNHRQKMVQNLLQMISDGAPAQ